MLLNEEENSKNEEFFSEHLCSIPAQYFCHSLQIGIRGNYDQPILTSLKMALDYNDRDSMRNSFGPFAVSEDILNDFGQYILRDTLHLQIALSNISRCQKYYRAVSNWDFSFWIQNWTHLVALTLLLRNFFGRCSPTTPNNDRFSSSEDTTLRDLKEDKLSEAYSVLNPKLVRHSASLGARDRDPVCSVNCKGY